MGQLLTDQLGSLTELCSSEGEVVSRQARRNYLFVAAADTDTVQGCILRAGSVWTAKMPDPMPTGAPIDPMKPTPAPIDTGAYPLMGRVAAHVTDVVVVLADGRRRDAYLGDGFYSLMLPATDAVGLTYVVYTDDGQSMTIGPE